MPRRSLRLRLLFTFGLGALVLSSLFASLTYFGVQKVLVSDRQKTDLRESFENAELIRSTLYTSPAALPSLLNSIETATVGQRARAHAPPVALAQPRRRRLGHVPGVLEKVDAGQAADQTISVNGHLLFVVGVPIPAVETTGYEIFQLDPLEHTLRTLCSCWASERSPRR